MSSEQRPRGLKIVMLLKLGRIKAPVTIFGKYRGAWFEGEITENGMVRFGGQSFGSLSSAAVAVKRNMGVRQGCRVNGWSFWRVHDDKSGKLVPLQYLRGDKEM
jgi:hypothetical protein